MKAPERRASILAAAEGLFLTQGFSATTPLEVSQAAGISRPSLYTYVPDLHALLAEVTAPHLDRLTQDLKAWSGAPKPDYAELVQLLASARPLAQLLSANDHASTRRSRAACTSSWSVPEPTRRARWTQ